ncbi:pyridoxamine kinase [Liquorilactobacillus sicerae]|uniref:pyridoxamine kinase n=1 Tax=Liquorilactobacillus sicerae TaxID=1416943 RepID=UPI002480E50D|nr:pyridoxamine kinase [Liquorilactobacillus sicerae]
MELNALIVEDLSCAGQVSLTSALPILGAAGCQPTVLPTALLSTHTGGFGNNTYLDLSNEMVKIIQHWQTIPLTFSNVLLGYLGRQPAKIILNCLPLISTKNSFILLDPVMADNGQLYRGFDLNYVSQIRKLASQANLLTPNVTEAELLLGQTPTNGSITLTAAQNLLRDLKNVFPTTAIVLTGVTLKNQIAVLGLENFSREIWQVTATKKPGNFFGTGDLFASLLLAYLIHHYDLLTAVKLSMNFILKNISAFEIKKTFDQRFGLDYSSQLPVLLKQLEFKGGK